MFESVIHSLGLCGEQHPTILGIFLEYPQINHIFNYIKTWRLKPMKCIKNINTGDIQRVDDRQADAKVGSIWKFIPKSEWKAVSRKTEKYEVEMEKKGQTISEKALKRKKLKAKQRQ